MSKSYDNIFRENIEPVFETFVRHILDIHPTKSQTVSLGQPKTSERKPDYLCKIHLPDQPEPVIFHIEFQTEPDSQMHLRMLEYQALIRRRFKLDVHQYVLLLSGPAERMPTTIQGVSIQYEYRLIELRQISFEALIESNTPELLVIAILSDFDKRETVGNVRRILAALKQRVTGQRELQKYLTQLELLSNIRNISKTVTEEISNMALTYNLETDARYIQGIEKGIEKGLKKGLEKGIEKGIEKTQLELARRLMDDGHSIEYAAHLTGLELDELKKLNLSGNG
jgi:predicted transposase/invertase (TIGR01784 family)